MFQAMNQTWSHLQSTVNAVFKVQWTLHFARCAEEENHRYTRIRRSDHWQKTFTGPSTKRCRSTHIFHLKKTLCRYARSGKRRGGTPVLKSDASIYNRSRRGDPLDIFQTGFELRKCGLASSAYVFIEHTFKMIAHHKNGALKELLDRSFGRQTKSLVYLVVFAPRVLTIFQSVRSLPISIRESLKEQFESINRAGDSLDSPFHFLPDESVSNMFSGDDKYCKYALQKYIVSVGSDYLPAESKDQNNYKQRKKSYSHHQKALQ